MPIMMQFFTHFQVTTTQILNTQYKECLEVNKPFVYSETRPFTNRTVYTAEC